MSTISTRGELHFTVLRDTFNAEVFIVFLDRLLGQFEETFQGAKELAGLDEHQVRTWTSWHRWTTLAMLAYAFLAITRAHQTDPDDPGMIPLTCNEVRHLLVSAITPDLDWRHRLRWSRWRRRHQATAKRLHYQRQHALTA